TETVHEVPGRERSVSGIFISPRRDDLRDGRRFVATPPCLEGPPNRASRVDRPREIASVRCDDRPRRVPPPIQAAERSTYRNTPRCLALGSRWSAAASADSIPLITEASALQGTPREVASEPAREMPPAPLACRHPR